jgi:succinate dehydrogenase hydrophobic anchor subunit
VFSHTKLKVKSPLEAEGGPLATHINHKFSQFLAVAAPLVFILPDSWTDGIVNKVFGLSVAVTVAAHSWVGLNAIASDYVPKLSKAALPPARIFFAASSGIAFLGLSKIALNDKGGLKGAVKGLWSPRKEEEK